MHHPDIVRARVYRYALTLDFTLPLKSTRLSVRRGLIVELQNQEGRCFYGEAAPLPDFSEERLEDATRQLKYVLSRLCPSGREQGLLDSCYPSVAFAVESALYASRQKVWASGTVPVSPLLLGSDEQVIDRLGNWSDSWPEEFKVKVGRYAPEVEADRVLNFLDHLPDEVKLRLDANQRWNLQQACQFAQMLPVGRVSYVEEPTPDSKDFPELYQKTGLRYALDESLQKKRVKIEWGDGLAALIIKPTLVGGIERCRQWIECARQHSVRVVFSSAFESHLGVRMIEQLSLSLTPGESPGLDTLSAFRSPLCYQLPDSPGLPLPEDTLNRMELLWEYSYPLCNAL